MSTRHTDPAVPVIAVALAAVALAYLFSWALS